MGTLEDGTKELVTVWDGIRESTESWREVLRDLKARGLVEAPKLAVGDGVPAQRRGCSLHVLRLSGGTLEAYPGDESNRIGVRDGAASAAADEGLRLAVGDVDDGFQVGEGGGASLAKAQWLEAAGEGRNGC